MTARLPRGAAVRARAALAILGLLAGGVARAGSNTSVSGSVYADYWWIQQPAVQKRSPAGITIDAAVKVGVDVSDDVSFSTKACMSCHGIELEHIQMDYMPKSWFNVAAGRMALPFGEYANRVDPSSHKTVSAPLIYDMGRMAYGEKTAFNLGVVPLPYTDTGVMVYGQRFLGKVQAWYGVYGVGGFRGSNDADWTAMRSLYYTDTNRTPSLGGRLALTLAAEPSWWIGDVSIGASGTGGRYDRDATLRYMAWGADASIRIEKFTFRGEYAYRKTDLNPAASYPYELVDAWFRKDGWYAEVERPFGSHLALVYRWDTLHREGTPLTGATELTPDSTITRQTAGLVITPASSVFVKVSWEQWRATDFTDFQSIHFGVGGAF